MTVIVTGIRQDEPVDELGDGATCPDARGIGTAGAFVRAERAGVATDRVYHIAFTASDGRGGSCAGIVRICVPHDQGLGQSCRDEGPLYDSTGPCRRQRPKN